jgi:FAD/FMN-containing dehydrogenase
VTDAAVYATADSPDYAQLCAAFGLRTPPLPARVTRARSVEEVQDAVRYAAAEGLRVAAFATGHASGRLGRLDDALLIRTAIDAPVAVDPEARTALVPAGARWGDVGREASPFGLMGLHGSSPTVGAIGYLINGGLSFAGRRHGVAANSVLRFQLVGADGAARWVDRDHEPDLFWALRGGGAGVGIVTAAEVRLFPAAAAYTGIRFWSAAHAGPILRRWGDWAADAPTAATTTARIMNLPPLPFVPPQLTGGPVIALDGAVVAETAEDTPTAQAIGDDLLRRFEEFGEPLLDTWHLGPAADMAHTHMDPEDPSPAWTGHDLLSGLPDAAIDALVDLGHRETPLLSTELRQLGGAFAQPAEAGGVFDRVTEPFLLQALAITPAPGVLEAATAHHEALRAELRELITGRCAPTFLDANDGRTSGDESARQRLEEVRRAADPDGRFAVLD